MPCTQEKKSTIFTVKRPYLRAFDKLMWFSNFYFRFPVSILSPSYWEVNPVILCSSSPHVRLRCTWFVRVNSSSPLTSIESFLFFSFTLCSLVAVFIPELLMQHSQRKYIPFHSLSCLCKISLSIMCSCVTLCD